jgi:O-antigen ligase
MEILIVLAIPAAVVWGLVLLGKHEHSRANLLPAIALAVLLTGSVFGYEFFHLSGGPIPITLDRVLLAGLVAMCAICWLRGTEDLRPLNRVDILILTLIGINSWSMLTHDWRFLDNLPASRLLFFYFLPFVLYFVMRSVRLNVADLKWISLALGGLGLYLAGTAIAETRDWTAVVFPRYIMNSSELEFLGRGRGPFLNPVANGIFQVICVCAMWMWWPSSSLRGKIMLGGLTGIMAAGIFCTLTRSVWLGFLASAGVFIWYPASRQTKGLLIIVATLVSTIAFPLVGEKFFSFKRDNEVSLAEMENSAALRPLFVIVAWRMFQDRPLLGCGFGQYAREKYPYLQDPHSGQPLSSTKYFMQHNVFLAYLTELGLLGLTILLLTMVAMANCSWSLWKNQELNQWARLYGLLMIVMMINYLLNGMFHDVSIIPMQNMLLLFLFGIVNNIRTSQVAFQHSDDTTGVVEDRRETPSQQIFPVPEMGTH